MTVPTRGPFGDSAGAPGFAPGVVRCAANDQPTREL